MTTYAEIEDFLAQKRFAFAGVSRSARDFSREIFREFRNKGYDPVPVHPLAAEIEGSQCFARVRDIQPPIDTVLLMTSQAVTASVVQDCIAAGIKRVWFYRGAATRALNDQAIEQCRAAGLQVIPGECPLMFLPQAGVIHRFHGWVKKIRGTYPA
jgi:predicted CoA-binding protein